MEEKPDIVCSTCGAKKKDAWPMNFLGKEMWYVRSWTCGHRETITCRECYDEGHQLCPVCGCKEEHT